MNGTYNSLCNGLFIYSIVALPQKTQAQQHSENLPFHTDATRLISAAAQIKAS